MPNAEQREPRIDTATNPTSQRADNFRREDLQYWDNLFGISDDTLNPNAESRDPAHPGDVPPELRRLALPSNSNISDEHQPLELTFRLRKAESILTQIRDLIAEKSFKYTDEIRKAPRKGVRTRGRTSIIELNRRLSFLCQVYAWNRARMVDLKADKDTLDLYQILETDHVRCSTAVLKPNQPGSTKLKLSWIWQSVDRRIMAGQEELRADQVDSADPATITECKQSSCDAMMPAMLSDIVVSHSPTCSLVACPSVGGAMARRMSTRPTGNAMECGLLRISKPQMAFRSCQTSRHFCRSSCVCRQKSRHVERPCCICKEAI